MLGTASQGSSLIELALKLNPQEGQALFELIWAETIFSCCWEETQELLKVYLKDKVQKENFQRFLAQISSYLPFSAKEAKERWICKEDYLFKWKDHFKPLIVGKNLHICPPWSVREPEKFEVVIEPGIAFGRGSHATTRGCLIALERLLQVGDTLLDVGTGSGVLAIASIKLRAAQALGIDTDSQALLNARRNAQLNQAEGKVCFLEMLLERLRCGSFDLIVANLDFPTLTAGIANFKKLSFCFLIRGGILFTESPRLEAGYTRFFQLKDSLELNGWQTLIWKKQL